MWWVGHILIHNGVRGTAMNTIHAVSQATELAYCARAGVPTL